MCKKALTENFDQVVGFPMERLKYQLSSTNKTSYDSLFLIIDWLIGLQTEQRYGARSTSQIYVHIVKSMHF